MLDLKEGVINEVVEEAVEAANAYAAANEVSLKYTPPHDDFMAMIDESWLRQAVLIIIDNAVKFSKPNDQVTISIEEVSPPGANGPPDVLIKVMDEGPGIEDEAIDHLFERYYQAKEGQKREGTGLGLAIAKWIIDGHNGAIWAENGKQGGAIMTMKLKQI